MFRISCTVNLPSHNEDVSVIEVLAIQGPFTQSQYEDYIRLTLAAYPEASSFEFILIPAEAGP